MSVIVMLAATPKGEIGYQNTIPWKLKGDLKRFKEVTMGHIVIVGRKTYESFGRALEGREMIVVSTSMFKELDGMKVNRERQGLYGDEITVAHSFAVALEYAKGLMEGYRLNGVDTKDIFIAGGVSLYEEGLKIADRVYLTLVHKKPTFYNEDAKKMRELFNEVVRTGGSNSPKLNEAYEFSKTLNGKYVTYDAVIPNFNLNDYSECDAEVILDEENDANNIPRVSHSFHTFIRLDKDDPDPEKTLEIATHEIQKSRTPPPVKLAGTHYPVGVTSLAVSNLSKETTLNELAIVEGIPGLNAFELAPDGPRTQMFGGVIREFTIDSAPIDQPGTFQVTDRPDHPLDELLRDDKAD